MLRQRLFSPLVAFVLVAAGGCYATISPEVRGRVWVSVAPPLPYVEIVGVAPGPTYVWVPGYWWWDGLEYLWIRGQWERPPRPGYVYVRSGWTRVDGDYRFVHGRWVAPNRRPRVTYVHPAPRVRVETNARTRYRTVRPSQSRTRAQPSNRPSRGRSGSSRGRSGRRR